MTSQEAKARGVSAYRDQNWALAIDEFQRAIDHADETDELHLYYSNRSAALMQCGRIDEAIADAEACTQINPCFAKGWSRLGAGLLRKGGLRNRAIAALEKAVELEPSNADARAALARARDGTTAGVSGLERAQQAGEAFIARVRASYNSWAGAQGGGLLHWIGENRGFVAVALLLLIVVVHNGRSARSAAAGAEPRRATYSPGPRNEYYERSDQARDEYNNERPDREYREPRHDDDYREPRNVPPRQGRYEDRYSPRGAGGDMFSSMSPMAMLSIGGVLFMAWRSGALRQLDPYTILMLFNMITRIANGGRGRGMGRGMGGLGRGMYGMPGMGGFGRRRF